MKFGTGIGIVISLIGIAMGATMEGTNVMVVLNVPAILIVLVGTLGASIAACGLKANIRLPKLFLKAFMPDDLDLVARVSELVGDAENEAMRKRHAAARNPFMQAGALAPTMGIVGTVFGLVNVMNNLNNPSSLGPLIAAAFLATLMGVGSANVVFLPMANRLKELSEEELHFREMTLEGVLAIQAGDNPRVVEEKLMAFVPPKLRPSADEAASGG